LSKINQSDKKENKMCLFGIIFSFITNYIIYYFLILPNNSKIIVILWIMIGIANLGLFVMCIIIIENNLKKQ
jgi:hypothetical protein